jgi:hypothetical protein
MGGVFAELAARKRTSPTVLARQAQGAAGGSGERGGVLAELAANRQTADAASQADAGTKSAAAAAEAATRAQADAAAKVEAALAAVVAERLTEAEQYMCSVLGVPQRGERLAALSFKHQLDPQGASSSGLGSGSGPEGRAAALVAQAKALQAACLAVRPLLLLLLLLLLLRYPLSPFSFTPAPRSFSILNFVRPRFFFFQFLGCLSMRRLNRPRGAGP